MNQRFRRSLTFLAFLSLTFLLNPAHARYQSRFEVINFKPSMDNGPYFATYGSQNLKTLQGHVGLYFDYASRPLQFIATGAASGRQSVIDNLFLAHITGAFGVSDWFEMGLNIPVVLYNWFFMDDIVGLKDPGGGMGDIELGFKFRLVNNQDSVVGFSVMPFGTLPSGDETRYTGNGALAGGLRLITDFNIHERFQLALNLGGLFRDDVIRHGVRVDEQFLYGIGANIKFSEGFYGIIEAMGKTTMRNFFRNSSESPLEAMGGLRYLFPNSGFGIDVGGSAGIIDGVGAPRFRGFAGVHWTGRGGGECKDCPPPAPPPDPRISGNRILIWGKIYFDTAKATIKPISYPILDDVVDVMRSNPHIRLVEVQGHADRRGSDALNLKLSQERANSTRQYLVDKGVEPSRLVAKGYGFRQPTAEGMSREALSENRRVEFVIVQKDY